MKKEHTVPPRQLPAHASLTRRTLLAFPAALLAPAWLHAQPSTLDPAPRTPSKGPRGQIVVGVSQEPTVFNPLMPRIEVDQGVWFALFNPLWRAEPDGSFVPELAAEVPSLENGGISADGLLWRIRLRKGVKWHDGAEFTAEDVKYTLELLNNPSFKAYTRQGHSFVKDITVVGPHELTWKMSKAFAPYLALLTWTFMVPKHVLGAASDPNIAPFNSAPIGTGPFRWGKRTAGQGVTLEANKDYFGDGPHVERVIFNYVPDSNVLYTQFKTGQIDYIGYYGVAAQYVKDAMSLRDRKVERVKSAQVESIVMNFGKPIFQDKAVRRALYTGMNKKAIIDSVYYGLPLETESFTPRFSWAFNANLPKHAFDPAAGNSMLEEAGWIKGPDGIRAKGGLRLDFTVATVSGNPQREQVLQLVQQDWKKLGVAMTIKTMPAAVVFGDYYTKSQFDCLLLSSTYGTGADPDPTQRFSSSAIPAQGGSGLNYYQYKNAEVDRLLVIAQTTFKQAERKEAYQKIQSLMREDLAILPICTPTPVEGTKAKLVGYQSNPCVASNSWNIGSWRWEV
ncbi:peptide ABC transporter substrate-binding protein [Variovorax boronicumulans]|uniref:peptide ABC transporter substrate-binding protein n=1 Tax=Variovorax boronicumulans TaxID=436515 RepID=UPI001C5A26C3